MWPPGVVAGIGGYGNAFGCPTVGGEVVFEPCYSGNPLVNAFCLGITTKDKLFLGRAEGIGNTVFQPLPCMHCEQAPCELVCPVGATMHDSEGLNVQVYNRCIGTRFCSNNCPYKVRRFNYLLFQDWETPSLKLGRNPNVTVRSRGVMEKCTYCVQRINEAKITAEKESRRVKDGEIQTACQAVCPTEAIVFGDLNDPQSRVAKLQAEQRNYAILADLNTRPRTTYLGAVRNVNPELGEA